MKQKNRTYTVRDIYKEVTDFVMEQLEKGVIVWRKGWGTKGTPRNIITSSPYRGWNVFYLNYFTSLKQYPTSYFITFKQTQATLRWEKSHLKTMWL